MKMLHIPLSGSLINLKGTGEARQCFAQVKWGLLTLCCSLKFQLWATIAHLTLYTGMLCISYLNLK